MSKENDIELHNEEVQDILTVIPHWMIRWGNVIILLIIIVLFCFSYYVKYPDIVQTKIIITTQIPPEKVVAKTTGRIELIFVEDKSLVLKHTPLAVIENSANYQDVLTLKKIMQNINVTSVDIEFPFELTSSLQLGSVEAAYSNFEKSYLEYSVNKNLQPYLIDKQAQHFEQIQQESRLQLLLQQKDIVYKELAYWIFRFDLCQ
ncbi:hypothetical protein [Myroides pelagicus]|uniref:Uncharacterized protein n=1 Tax=Myroides pelagicus TaxID=270914 RepID=A0A7K1GRL1_9FLAO|nr:hypothetical protein [Myroides pelagicus]MTH31019.1 hypothetical protein [Myroides pelagicus]